MTRHWKTRALFASALALASCQVLAKNNSVAPTAQPATNEPPETLENLGERRLMSELADRGLDSLLDRYFDLHKTPDADQRAIRSTEAMRDLDNSKLSNSEKSAKVKQIVAGLEQMLPQIKDPFKLANDAGMLLLYGVTRDANLLEYWGENPATEARLRPTAQAVYDMLGKAAKEASSQAGILAGRMNANNQNVLGPQWDKLDNLSHTAEYSQNMMTYYLALATPKAERATLIEKSLKYLTDLDNADSTVMPRVHVMMAKLNMAEGKNDDAIQMFEAVAKKAQEIQPPPDASQVYEAKYFENVALLQEGKIDDAKKGLDALIAWQKTGMPPDADTQKGIAAAAEMLRYRIFLAEAAQAKDPAAKKKADDAGVAVLLKLSQDRPELRGIIYQQLVERLPKDAPVKGLDPLLLQGLMSKAYGEASKPAGAAVDQGIIQRGLSAAQEVSARPVDANLTARMKDDAAQLVPVLLEAMGKKVEAAQGYLDYAEKNSLMHPQNAQNALDDAGRLTFDLRKTDRDNPAVSDLYNRFLPVAINPPYNKIDLAYLYGQRLVTLGKPEEAIRFFHMVAKSDRNYNSAQYAMLRANQDLLSNPKIAPDRRAVLANDLVKSAESVRQTYGSLKDDVSRERDAIATLVEAETEGADLKKPQETLTLLTGFEDLVKGTPDEKALTNSALLDRVNADVALNQIGQATDMLLVLLNQTGGAQGAEFVRGLLDKLDKELDKAQAANDTATMASIAASEAKLSGFLVTWAKNNTNTEIKKFTYQYMVFDARTKRLAGTLATDAAARTDLLAKAMEAYKTLQSPENVALFKETLDKKKIASGDLDPNQPDPNVLLGIALTEYEQKNYKDAGPIFGDLLNNGKLGSATLLVTDPTSGEQKVTDNDTYWEATYKLYVCNVANAGGSVADASLDPTKQGLKNLLIRGGIPGKWQDKFEDLRKQIIPDFDVATRLNNTTQPSAATSQPAAATQPVSSTK